MAVVLVYARAKARPARVPPTGRAEIAAVLLSLGPSDSREAVWFSHML